MDFVIAIKAEPTRQARATSKNKVTLLLSDASEAADKTILHRDATYNNKLQGNCFTCSKLNANPPQSVCGVIDPPPPPTDCFDISSNPCVCAVCPPPVVPRTCSQGYLAANTAGYGSGYWVGLQANTYYSNISGGGWVVAVGCGTGGIVGAFPVTGSNFGYGTGSIAGHSVMIYPAGAIHAAGLLPENNTSFPLLGLTTQEGNAIISSGSFGAIASGTTTPGSPYQPGGSPYYCSAENSSVYAGFPKACVSKYPYGSGSSSGCSEYDNFTEWPDGIPYDTDDNNSTNPYFVNLAGVNGYNSEVGLAANVSISFSSSGGSFCGGFSGGDQQPSDPVSGTCGARSFPATPTGVHSNCKQCTDETVQVPCQFAINATNGNFDSEYGGFSGAGNNGYFSIGPAFAPTVTNNEYPTPPTVNNSSFWETQWGWSYNGETLEDGSNRGAIIPPMGSMNKNCKCPNGTAPGINAVIFIESYPCCTAGCSPIAPSGVGAISIQTPGHSGCGAGCQPRCPTPKCSCAGSTSGSLGRSNIYGYVPCHTCDCSNDPNNPTDSGPLNTENSNTTIWWADGGIGLSAIDARNQNDATIQSPCRNACKDVYKLANPVCASNCVGVMRKNIENDSIEIDNSVVLACTGFNNLQDLLDDPCGRAYYLPAKLNNCTLTVQSTPVHNLQNSGYPNGGFDYENHYNYNVVNYIDVSGCSECSSGADGKTSLRDCLCGSLPPNECYLSGISGPFADAVEQDCGGVFFGALYGCSQPSMDQVEAYSCGNCQTPEMKDKLVFKEILNDCRDANNQTVIDDLALDPCGCCGGVIDPTGGGSLNGDINNSIPSVGCSNNGGNGCQADCCQGSGCANAACPLPNGVFPPDCSGNGSDNGDNGNPGGPG